MGSDHDVYQDSSFGIPAIYMNDWPDRHIHTNFDIAANIDTTKLKRAAFVGAASGYFLATQLYVIRIGALEDAEEMGRATREAQRLARSRNLEFSERQNSFKRKCEYDVNALMAGDVPGFMTFMNRETNDKDSACVAWAIASVKKKDEHGGQASASGGIVFRRKAEPKGPLAVFGYDYFADHAKTAGVPAPKLFNYEGLWGSGEEYAYEVLNFADGRRNTREIRDAVSAEYGPVPLEMVVEYLKALEKIGLVAEVN
jgi:hypothetical protein